ncbi:MAG TPA: hypothetical protein VJN18_35535 [Polyangiaceae bacterium]|nr:hypothetical protein [Polyangiaceae bacterium]
MTEDDRRRAFSSAFIAQARSEWAVFNLLAGQSGVPVCHQLHYLQMVCEKVAKAYRLRDTKTSVDDLVSKHSGFAKFVGPFFLAVLKDDYVGKDAQLTGLIAGARKLAREIEKLAPAIDRLASPENAEYPWERDNAVTAPCDYSFPSLDLLRQAGGRTFLKLVTRALDEFDRWAIR